MEDQCPAVLETPLWRRILSFFFPNFKQLTSTLPSLKQTILIPIFAIIILVALRELRELRIEFYEALMRSFQMIVHPNYAAGVEIKTEARRARYRQSRVFDSVEAVQQYREVNRGSEEEKTGEGSEGGIGCVGECGRRWHPHPRRKRLRWATELEIIEE